MAIDCDIRSTDRLPGVYLAGTVGIRFLVNYAVPPDSLQPLMPPGCAVSTHNGLAWLSVCAVRLEKLRPSILPRLAGVSFNYLILRTVAELPYPDGKKRNSVMILESNIGGRLAARAGLVTGIRPVLRKIDIDEDVRGWRLRMWSVEGQPLYDAEFPKIVMGQRLPEGSSFADRDDSFRFLMEMSFGAAWDQKSGVISLLAETHDPCISLVGAAKTTRFDFLDGLTKPRPEADHVIIMQAVPHQFALRGLKVKV
ncbi:MAG TPA: DUF2071 domain-containing protein [Thermoplasmata archaeon]|nr:DUF2071 domain-containing protein [Thermoplasmata archaeon]